MEEKADGGGCSGEGDEGAEGVGKEVEGVAGAVGGQGGLENLVEDGESEDAGGDGEHDAGGEHVCGGTCALVVERDGSRKPSHHYGVYQLVEVGYERE